MFESYSPYNPYNSYSPYYGYNFQSQQSQQSQQIPRQNQQIYRNPSTGLQGKVVDSLDVVKATDIPYDGSVSYFPLTDNSAIITKQLQPDGTSKVVVYKPEIGKVENTPKYVTEQDFEEKIKEQIKGVNSKDIKDMKEDIKTLKRKLEDISDDLKDKKEK